MKLLLVDPSRRGCSRRSTPPSRTVWRWSPLAAISLAGGGLLLGCTPGFDAGSSAHAAGSPSAEPLPLSSAAQPFVLESFTSYLGADDQRLVVRSREATVELTESPQDSSAVRDGATLGRFRAELPPRLRDQLAALLPGLLAPSPAPPAGSTPPRVMDAPVSGVTVEQAGVKRTLMAPEAHSPSPDLIALLVMLREEARRHPLEAIQLKASPASGGFALEVVSVGTAPVTLAHPLALRDGATGLFLVRWTPPTPAVSPLPASREPIALRGAPGGVAPTVRLAPGERLVLPSVAWTAPAPRSPGEHLAVVAQWGDRGTSRTEAGGYRVRGFARSAVVELGSR